MLPQVGNERLYPGDSVTCGLCFHVWIPMPIPPVHVGGEVNQGLDTERFGGKTQNAEPSESARTTQTVNLQTK